MKKCNLKLNLTMPFYSDLQKNFNEYKFKSDHIKIDNELHETLKENCVDKKKILINEWYVKQKLNNEHQIIFCKDSKNDRLFSFLLVGSATSIFQYLILPFTMTLPENFPVDPPKIQLMFKPKSPDYFFNCIDTTGVVHTSLLGNNFNTDYSEQKEWNKDTDGFIEILNNLASIFNSSEPFKQTLKYEDMILSGTATDKQKEFENNLFNLRIFMFILKNCVIELINTLELPDNKFEHFKEEIIKHFQICKEPLTKIITKKAKLKEFKIPGCSDSKPEYIVENMEQYLIYDGIPFQTLIDMSIDRINEITK